MAISEQRRLGRLGTILVTKRKRAEMLTAALLLSPFIVVYIIFFLYPAFKAIALSFTKSGLVGNGTYVGLANYVSMLSDTDFWASLEHTVYFAVLTVIPLTVLGFAFALIVNRLNRFRAFTQGAFFLPYLLPVSVVVLIWQWLMNPSFGVINQLLRTNVAWFSDTAWAMPSVALVTIWWTVGFNVLLFLAGLQSVPQQDYEAAQLDGASSEQIFLRITWPLLWPITTLVLTLQLIASLKIFAQVYLLTGGGPFGTTRVALEYMYETAFVNQNAGYASTLASAFFVVVLVLSVLQNKLLNRG